MSTYYTNLGWPSPNGSPISDKFDTFLTEIVEDVAQSMGVSLDRAEELVIDFARGLEDQQVMSTFPVYGAPDEEIVDWLIDAAMIDFVGLLLDELDKGDI